MRRHVIEDPQRRQRIYMNYWQHQQNSAGADGGPRSRVHARGTLRSAPRRHQRIFFLFFCDLKPPISFQNPTTSPSRRKVTVR